MSWPIKHFHYIPSPSSFIEMMPGAMKAVKQCAGVKEGEHVVIACDTNKIRLAEAIAAAAYAAGGIPTITAFPPTGAHGAQVPKPVVGACAQSDVFFLPTTWSMTHTDARIEAIKNGARGTTMCEVTEDCLCTGGILADYEQNDRVGRKLGAIIAAGNTIRMTSPAGTDLTAKITDRPVQYETGLFREPGQFAALPNSELNISPTEGTTEGVIIGDVRLMGYGVLRDEPITIEVKSGEVVKVSGGKAADYLNETLKSFNDKAAYNLAEFAVGLNPCCRAYATNLEDLGKLGFGHHGIGSNYAIGGNVAAPCHIDVIYSEATLEIDGRKILESGNILV
ncbi:MAG: aminopeptidase [Deltaproteobacteria bacterium]|nr:aminopeptidase [Deltaproteobacteria bacterium]MBW2152262.1 aminopeptidase [Deltaproteobacteria bacterium]